MAKSDGSDSGEPIESNVDFAGVQARQQGASVAAQKGFPLPQLGFVSTFNGAGGGVTLGAGSLPAGVGLTVTNGGAGAFSINITGIDPIATKKSNLAAMADPAVGNDSSQGYAAGSFWLNTGTPSFWVAASVAIGAAVWVKLSP